SGKGLAVNGKKVVKAVLNEGDVVQIGDTEIRFTTSDPAYGGGSAAPPAGHDAPGGSPAHRQAQAAPSEGHAVSATPDEPRGYSRVWLQCVEGNDKGKTFDLS